MSVYVSARVRVIKKFLCQDLHPRWRALFGPGSSRCYYPSCHGMNAATRLLSNTQIPHLQDGRAILSHKCTAPIHISSSIFNQRTYCSLFDIAFVKYFTNYLLIEFQKFKKRMNVREFLFNLRY